MQRTEIPQQAKQSKDKQMSAENKYSKNIVRYEVKYDFLDL